LIVAQLIEAQLIEAQLIEAQNQSLVEAGKPANL
jgi:hypothetical protein